MTGALNSSPETIDLVFGKPSAENKEKPSAVIRSMVSSQSSSMISQCLFLLSLGLMADHERLRVKRRYGQATERYMLGIGLAVSLPGIRDVSPVPAPGI